MFSQTSFVSEGTYGGEIGFRFAKGQSRDWAVEGFEEFVRPSRFVVIYACWSVRSANSVGSFSLVLDDYPASL